MKYISILILALSCLSCKNEVEKQPKNPNIELEIKKDSDNTGSIEIDNIDRPEKTILRNLEIDTTEAFGIWAQDPNGPHADFWLTAKSFFVADYDGDGEMPYILDKNTITIFYDDFIQKGLITSTVNDTLKIKWSDNENETEYVKFEN